MERTVFDAPMAQLQFLAQSITKHGRHIDKYDALSISSVEIDDTPRSDSSGQAPRMFGLQRFTEEITHILDEGHIEQQAALAAFSSELNECLEVSHTVLVTLHPHQVHEVGKEAANQNPLIPVSLAQSTEEQRAEQRAQLLEKQVLVRLQRLYDSIQSLVDRKVNMLSTVHHVTAVYLREIIAMAQQSQVMYAKQKAEKIVMPYFAPLTNNRFFRIIEEEKILEQVRKQYALLQLGNDSHFSLAERQLSFQYFQRNVPHADWLQNMKIGAVIVLLLWALSECFNNESMGQAVWRDLTFSIFVCFGDLLLLLIMWGVSMRVWRTSGIDFMRLLELEKTELSQLKGHKTAEDMVFTSATNGCLVFLIMFIVFNKVIRGAYFGENIEGSSLNKNNIVAHSIPTVFVLYAFYRLIVPSRTRRVWWEMLWQVLAAPLYPVNFRAGYIGDLLTSLVRVLIPLVFSVLYVAVSLYAWLSNSVDLITHRKDVWWTESWAYTHCIVPFCTLLPLWLRFVQCLRRSVESGSRWPHIPNALKYTSAIVVIAFGTFQPNLRSEWTWIWFFIFATCYQYTWDITQDWGFIGIKLPRSDVPTEQSSGLNFVDCLVRSSLYFRPTRLIGPLWLYGLVMVFNFALRFAWTLTLLPPPEEDSGSLYVSLVTHLGPLLAAAEIIRRMVWGFFRLEWEQIERQQKTDAAMEEITTNSCFDEQEQVNSFEKMDVTSTFEVAGDGAVLMTEGYLLQNGELWMEWDWTALMPSYVREAINACPGVRHLPDFRSRLRCVEAIGLVVWVLFALYHSAAPAFAIT